MSKKTNHSDRDLSPADRAMALLASVPGSASMSNMFPGAGDYFVEVSDNVDWRISHKDPENPSVYVAIPVTILKHRDVENSTLVGKSFQTFMSLKKIPQPSNPNAPRIPQPIDFAAQTLYALAHDGEYPERVLIPDAQIKEWLDALPGSQFVVRRSVVRVDGRDRERDKIIPVQRFRAMLDRENTTPEPAPDSVDPDEAAKAKK